MKGVNKAIILGRLGQDPEVRATANGTSVTTVSVATSFYNKSQDREDTEWHRVVMWGRLAEVAGQYLRKGAEAYFEGRIVTRKYQAQDGSDRYTTEIVAQEMQMMGGGSRDNQGQSRAPQQAPAQQSAPAPQQDNFDDIPF